MTKEISTNRTVTPNEAKLAIRKCIEAQRPLFMWGPPGIGKSDIVKQIGDEQKREVIDVRLSLWEPTDIKGIPFFNPETKTMTWAPPAELPMDPNSTAILFLDELNSAAPATQAAAFQLVLNRRVGTYQLPKGVAIVAAGNRDSDKGVTYRMPSPLANRFVHIEMKHSFDDWFEWATANNIHEQVVGYLTFAKNDLYEFDSKSSSRAFATPRSWSFVSDLLTSDNVSESTLTDLVSGSVGDGLAVKFMGHRKVAKQMPNPTDILNGKVTKFNIKEISAMYSLSISLCYELKEAHERKDPKWNQMSDFFFKFIMDNFPTEITVMAAKVALSNYQLPFEPRELKNFDEFHNRFSKYITAAME